MIRITPAIQIWVTAVSLIAGYSFGGPVIDPKIPPAMTSPAISSVH
jgi:hypothetical protein